MADLLTEEKKSELCLKCLYCCKSLYVPVDLDLGELNFYKNLRGCEIKFSDFRPFLILNNHPCQHLTTKGCAIYQKRPMDCALFDGRKDRFHPEKCLWTQEERRLKGGT